PGPSHADYRDPAEVRIALPTRATEAHALQVPVGLGKEPELWVKPLAQRPMPPILERVPRVVAEIRERLLMGLVDRACILVAAEGPDPDPLRPLRVGRLVIQLGGHAKREVLECEAARLEQVAQSIGSLWCKHLQ